MKLLLKVMGVCIAAEIAIELFSWAGRDSPVVFALHFPGWVLGIWLLRIIRLGNIGQVVLMIALNVLAWSIAIRLAISIWSWFWGSVRASKLGYRSAEGNDET